MLIENHEEREEDQGEKIRVSLRIAPGVNDVSIEVPSDPIAVPADLRRKGLSALVNHMLGRRVIRDTHEEEKSVDETDDEEDVLPALPFDFILNGRLLRMGVEAAARRDGLSLEEAIELQYFVAQPAPRHAASSEDIPDWVSTLSFCSGLEYRNQGNLSKNVNGLLFCACYDGSIRALSPNDCSVVTATTSQRTHAGAVKCMDTKLMNIDSADDNEYQFLVATGSMDQTLLTHTLSFSRSDDSDTVGNPTLTLHCSYIDGHTNSVESLALDRSTSEEITMASGDWDGSLCLWRVPCNVDGTLIESPSTRSGGSSKKRLKVDQKGSTAMTESSAKVSPIAKWDSHTASVSGIVWGVRGDNGKKHLITSSWDHSCKVWDVERQECALTLNGSRVVSALGRCSNSDIIATGHPDCTVRLWDMRVGKNSSGTMVSENNLKPSHRAWVSALQWSPVEPHVLATTGHDGTLKIFDIRSSLPLHSVRVQKVGDKGLCIAYGPEAVFCGGTDCLVNKYKF